MLTAPNSTKNLQWMWVAITSYTIQALSPLCQFFYWKKTSIVNVSVIASTTRGSSAPLLYNSGCSHCMYSLWMYDPWLLRLSPLQLKKNTCSASRLLSTGCCGTACMTQELCLTVLRWKQMSTVNVRAAHCIYAPWPPSTVSSPTPKRTCSAWRLLSYRTQAMGSLSVCSSTEICGCKCHRMYDAWVLRLSSLQLKRILAVQAGDCHCMYHPWPLFSCSSTESKLSLTVKASAKLAVSVVRLSLRVHEKKIAEMWKWWPFFHGSSDPAPAAFPKVLSSWVCCTWRHSLQLQSDSVIGVSWIKYHPKPRRLKRAYDQAARFVKTNDDTHTGPKRWQHSTKKVLRFPRRQCDWSEFTTQNGVFHRP